jgi:hypothetical protein
VVSVVFLLSCLFHFLSETFFTRATESVYKEAMSEWVELSEIGRQMQENNETNWYVSFIILHLPEIIPTGLLKFKMNSEITYHSDM